jgi:hypothetical protein
MNKMVKDNYLRFCRVCEEVKPAYAKKSKQCKDCFDKKFANGHPMKGKKFTSKYNTIFEKVFGVNYKEHKEQLDKEKKQGVNEI